jgi:predicted GNAT family N-acyltransferase
MEPAQFRAFEPEDLESVVAIFRSNVPKYFGLAEEEGLRNFLGGFTGDYYLLELNGEVVGSGGVAQNHDNTVSLCWGMVHANHLGTGLGKTLTEFRIEKAHEKFGNMPLVVTTSQHTRGFYEKLGFRLTEHRRDGFGPGIDMCKMRKEA